MRHRVLWALIPALSLVFGCWSTAASADIVDLTNGVRLPKRVKTKWGKFPTEEELESSGTNNLKLTYEAFELGRTRGDAAQVARVYATAAFENVDFRLGERHGERGYWTEAVQAFVSAADDLSGVAKQVALHMRMLAAANTNDPALAMRAADEVLAADPKVYYYGPAQETRARIFAQAGRMREALTALKQVTDAPGMNVRDYFNAAYLSVWLTAYIRADSMQAFAKAETAFRDLLTELERNPRRQLADVPKQKIMMSLAACVRSQGRGNEAKQVFEEILGSVSELTDESVLVGVYYGLGDVAVEEAAELQKKAQANPQVRKKVRELLDAAALHYLRVILLYKDYAGQRELFGATRGVARVFSTLFTVDGEKDCETAKRSYDFYRQAVQLQPRGEARRLLVLEAKTHKARMDEVCSEKEGDETDGGETER